MPESMLLAAIEDGRWKPGIGDPTVLGWVTVVAYFVAAAGCFRAAWREPSTHGGRRDRPATFWLVLATLLVALGINKQLDLQSFITQIGRDLARSRGFYAQRRSLQVGFILLVVLVCVGSLAVFLWAARRRLRERWAALLGMAFILGFVVIRAASFHHVDVFLAARLGGLKWNWILELGGIVTVGVTAFRITPGRPTRQPREGSVIIDYRRLNSR